MLAGFRTFCWGGLLAIAGCWLAGAGAASGQQADFRSFTNKDGQAVEAKVVSVSKDRRTLKGELRNGVEFEMAINLLSLDDQQYLQQWIKDNPNASATQFLLDVTFTKKEETTERKRDDYYRFTVKSVTYHIAVRNKTREALQGGLVEYAVIHEDGLDIARSDAGIPVTYVEELNPEREIISGNEKLPDSLAFNFVHEFVTKPVSTDTVEVDFGGNHDGDEVLGVLARISDRSGRVIGIYRSSETKMRDITWESAMGNKPPPTAAANDASAGRSVSSSGSSRASSSDGVDVRKLDSLPEILQAGDTLPADKAPDVVGKPVVATAVIDLDEAATDGVILAHGGAERGYLLFVFESHLQFWVKKIDTEGRRITRKVKLPLDGLPEGAFTVEAKFSAEKLELWIDGQIAGDFNSPGFLEKQPREGLSVGYDSERGSVGPAPANVPFRGEIREVRLEVGG